MPGSVKPFSPSVRFDPRHGTVVGWVLSCPCDRCTNPQLDPLHSDNPALTAVRRDRLIRELIVGGVSAERAAGALKARLREVHKVAQEESAQGVDATVYERQFAEAADLFVAEIRSWGEGRRGYLVEELVDEFGISKEEIRILNRRSDIKIQRRPRDGGGTVQYTESDMVDAIRRAYPRAARGEPTHQLSHDEYDQVRASTDPSSAVITARMGWIRACDLAGVPYHTSRPGGYRTRWTDVDMLVFVRSYFLERIAVGESLAYPHYEQHAKGRLNWPSGPALRGQLRKSLGGWGAIFESAMSLYEEQVADNLLWNLTQDLDDPMHGDPIAYDAGCRCSICVPGKSQASRSRVRRRPTTKERKRRLLAQLENDPQDSRHGTMDGFLAGCRCTRCSAAWRLHRHSQNQEQPPQLDGNSEDPRHGTIEGFREGCRCLRCEAAERVDRYQRERRGSID